MPYECFYTLPKRIEERRVIWKIEEPLRSHIEFIGEHFNSLGVSNREILEPQIARYLLEQLQQYPQDILLRKHWLSFLLRRCEKVAIAILRLIPTSSHSCSFSDLFQMGIEVVNDPAQFFINFDKRRFNHNYWYPTLKTFADSKIKHFLFPKIRELTGRITLGLTNLGLASRASRKQVSEALKQLKSSKNISQYLLAWQCFQEVKKSIKLEIRKFQAEHFQLIATRYNQFQKQLAFSQFTLINGATIRDWLEEIGGSIRQLLEPQLISVDRQFEKEEPLIITLPFVMRTDVDLLGNWEKDRTQIALIEFINSLLSKPEKLSDRQILLLRYGFKLNQSKIAEELKKNQSTIHHKLNSLHQKILSQIGEWIRQNLEIEPTSEGLNEIKGVLTQYYSDQIDGLTIDTIQLLEGQNQKLLKLFYVTGATKAEIAEKIGVSEAKVGKLLKAIAQQLYDCITERIEADIQLQFQSPTVKECIPALIERRLQTVLQLVQLDKD
jgi:DNA-directed RNA polymerase specialized sigma subunit